MNDLIERILRRVTRASDNFYLLLGLGMIVAVVFFIIWNVRIWRENQTRTDDAINRLVERFLPPRPSDAAFIQWLGGRRIVVQENILIDDAWIIEPKEVYDFKVENITRNEASKALAATISFRATSLDRGIECHAVFIYEEKNDQNLRLISFSPTVVKKIGNW